MKLHIPLFALCVSATILTAGCGKTDDPPLPKLAPQVPAIQGTILTPTLPSAPLPTPVVPKGAEAPSPMPGQAGDTSSPTFKDGGKADPHK